MVSVSGVYATFLLVSICISVVQESRARRNAHGSSACLVCGHLDLARIGLFEFFTR
jgi:hypothetical protein